jgi:hypothetical protein
LESARKQQKNAGFSLRLRYPMDAEMKKRQVFRWKDLALGSL